MLCASGLDTLNLKSNLRIGEEFSAIDITASLCKSDVEGECATEAD